MGDNDRRLIEDYLPIEAISVEASRVKSLRTGHISTLHLWWARRPLVACRAAVYGSLVPASRFVREGGSDKDGGWQMATGRWQMADGGWQMADGGWRMADGRWQTADGKWQMANGRCEVTSGG